MPNPPRATRILGRLALTIAIAAPLYFAIYRPTQLRWGATDAEVALALPGDAIAPHPIFNATRAITIAAAPEAVWPWLVQIGYGRAGWYSALDWFDNAGTPSATRIVPELQHLAVGDPLPIWEGVGQTVIAVEPGRSLLTASDRPQPDTWVWVLVPTDDGQTRLLWRMRNATYDWTSPFGVLQLVTDLGDFVFVRNILLGIKERVEGRPIESLAATTLQVALWFVTFVGFLASLVALVMRRDRLLPLVAVAGTYTVTLLLVFGMPPLWVDMVAAVGTLAGPWWLYRPRRRGDTVGSRSQLVDAAGIDEGGPRMPVPTDGPITSVAAPPPPLASAPTSTPRAQRRPTRAAQPGQASARAGTAVSGSPTARLGFWSAVLAASASLVFLIASVPVLLGAVAPPWANILTLVPSLMLAPALLILLVCVHDAAPDDKKVWSHLAVAFAGIYVALVSVVYVVQLAVVEPLLVRGDAARAGLLTIEPGGVLNAVDGLGYAFLCLALLVAAPVFAGTRLDQWIRWLLLANGAAVVPILLTYFVDRAFLVIAGPLWGIAVPTVSTLLAVSFRRARESPGEEESP